MDNNLIGDHLNISVSHRSSGMLPATAHLFSVTVSKGSSDALDCTPPRIRLVGEVTALRHIPNCKLGFYHTEFLFLPISTRIDLKINMLTVIFDLHVQH